MPRLKNLDLFLQKKLFHKWLFLKSNINKLTWQFCFKVPLRLKTVQISWLLFQVLPLLHFKRCDIFLWTSSFLTKNISNCVSRCLKLHNRYCHSVYVVLHQQKIWDHHQVDAGGNGRSHLSPFAAIYPKYGL